MKRTITRADLDAEILELELELELERLERLERARELAAYWTDPTTDLPRIPAASPRAPAVSRRSRIARRTSPARRVVRRF